MPHIWVLLDNDFTWETRVKRECETLLRAGYQVSLVATTSESTPALPEFEQWDNGLIVYRGISRRALVRSAWQSEPEFTALIDQLKTRLAPPDVIHANDIFTLTLASRLTQSDCYPHAQTVYDSHEFWNAVLPFEHHHEAQAASWGPARWLATFKLWRHRQALLSKQARFLARCDAIISVSSPILKALQTEGGRSSSIMTLLRNTPLASPEQTSATRLLHDRLSLPAEARIALYQGFIEPNKGLSELVAQLPNWDSTPWVLVMMGPIQDQPFFEQLMQTAPAGRCFFHPAVYGPELDAYTTSADLGVITIPPVHLSYRWCLPNKLFSYIHGELPIVCLNVLTECAALVNQHKMGLSIDRIEDLTRQLHDWQEDPPELLTARLNEWRQSCRHAKRELNWETEQQQLLNLYGRLLNPATMPEPSTEETPLPA